MIAAVSCATCSAPRRGAGDVSGRAKEVALQQKIDTESMQRARTTCNETASKIGADIAGLKAQLAQLQMSEKPVDGSATDVSSASLSTRHREFDDDTATRTLAVV